MKKTYQMPACRVIHIDSPLLLSGTTNSYSDDQGLIVFDPTEIDAGDGD